MLAACTLALLVALVVDASNTQDYPGADFRPRVVGYRLLETHQNPYDFRWTPGVSDRYVDPYLPSGLALTRTTVTPTTLLLQAPLELLSYQSQRVTWLVVQWALLLVMVALGWRWLVGADRWVFLAVTVLLMAGAYFWRLHVERGQVYIVYAFAFACVYVFARRRTGWGDLAAGIVLGIAIALRPPYALVLLPLALARRWVMVAAALGGAALAMAAPLAFRPSVWRDYAEAMTAQGRQYLKYLGAPPSATSWYPSVIEGRSYWSTKGFPTIDASVAKIAGHFGIAVTPPMLDIGLVVAVAALTVAFWWAGRGRRPRIEVLLLQGGVLVYVAEFFLAGTRYSYRDIMLLPLFLLLMVALGSTGLRASKWSWIALLGLLLGCVSILWLPGGPDYEVFVGEVLVTVSLIAITWIATRGEAQDSGAREPMGAVRTQPPDLRGTGDALAPHRAGDHESGAGRGARCEMAPAHRDPRSVPSPPRLPREGRSQG